MGDIPINSTTGNRIGDSHFHGDNPLDDWDVPGFSSTTAVIRRRRLAHRSNTALFDPSARPAFPLRGGGVQFFRPLKPDLHPAATESILSTPNYGPGGGPNPMDSFTFWSEFDAHNDGHNWNCGNGQLAQPPHSAKDPAFYLLHSQTDRVWAAWQNFNDRFANTAATASAPEDYANVGEFDVALPESTQQERFVKMQLGSFFDDMMWPWDGTQGSPMDSAGFPTATTTDDRPGPQAPANPEFSTAAFAASNIRNLAPVAEGRLEVGDLPRSFPRNRHMIDYEGRVNPAHGYGFCYDDVPFGRGENATPRNPGVLFRVEVPSPQTVGTPFTVRVTAIDAGNNTVTNYSGTVRLVVMDATPGLDTPNNQGAHINNTANGDDDFQVFSPSDNGVRIFTVTAHTAETISRFQAYNIAGGLAGESAAVVIQP